MKRKPNQDSPMMQKYESQISFFFIQVSTSGFQKIVAHFSVTLSAVLYFKKNMIGWMGLTSARK